MSRLYKSGVTATTSLAELMLAGKFEDMPSKFAASIARERLGIALAILGLPSFFHTDLIRVTAGRDDWVYSQLCPCTYFRLYGGTELLAAAR